MTLSDKIYNDLQNGERLTVIGVYNKYGTNSLSSIVSNINSCGKLVSSKTLPSGHKEYFIKQKIKIKPINLGGLIK